MTEREHLHLLNRRRFLIGSAATAASAVLAACGSSTSPTATSGAAATKAGGAATGSTPATGSAPAAGNTPAAQTTGGATPTFGAVSTVGVQVKTSIQNPPPGKPQGNKPSELVLVWGTDQLTTHAIDPQTHVGTIAESMLRHIYEPLVKIERDGKTISPLLATAWKRLDDNTLQFTLRQNIVFHNGEPFNADSVKYSILRPLDPKNNAAARSTYSVIDRVDVVDPYTVNVHTAKPDPALLSRMTGFSMVQLAPKWTEANALPGGVLKTANGTGPYKYKTWSPNQDLVVESNEQYWGGAPQIKNVRLKIIGEQATRVAALRSGEIHVAKDMPPEEVDSINAGGRQTARAVASNRVPYYVMETRKPPTDNPKVRQAINYAVDWDSIIQGVLLGNGTRIATVLPPWTVGFDPSLKPYPYDPEKAKSLLKDAGVAGGVDLNVWYQQGRYMKDKEVAEAFIQQLNKVGIRAKGNLTDPSVLTQKDNAKELDGLMFASWGNWIFDADNMLYSRFSIETRDTVNNAKGVSSINYGNTQFNDLITQARYTIDVDKRNALYAQAQQIMFADAPALFMYNLTDIYGVDNWVKWEPRFDEMVWAYEMKWNE
ncbi:MAG: ABC transporter substrate-binding protein [Thermomicrobia bacterium]|nr:ABC transporter substrate-binding protein [Thermomicrobia bacterium]